MAWLRTQEWRDSNRNGIEDRDEGINGPHDRWMGPGTPPTGPVANPFNAFGGMSGGMTRGPVKMPSRDLPGATSNNPNAAKPQKAGNTGFERFLAVHRGSRGGRLSGKKGFTYRSGKYKGMTQGEADVIAHQEFQRMGEDSRERYRQMNEGDYAAAREREIQAARDQNALAREFQAQLRADIRAEEAALKGGTGEGGDKGKGGEFDPNKPSPSKGSTPPTGQVAGEGKKPPVTNPTAKADAEVQANNKRFLEDQYPSLRGGGKKTVNPNATAGAGRGRSIKRKEPANA